MAAQAPYHCNLLIAGYDEGPGASLYWLDYLATLHKVNTGGTGYGECTDIVQARVLQHRPSQADGCGACM